MVLKGYGKIPVEYLQLNDSKTDATVIFIHGVGSSGLKQKERFIDLLGEDAYISHIKFIFPTAPSGYLDYLNKVTTIWYNVTNSKLPNLTEARTSINYIHSLYQAEVARGIDPSRIVIGGFSQGGCLAMGIGFTRTKKVRGIAVVGSIYDSSFQQIEGEQFPELLHLHGTADYLMTFYRAKKGFEYLTSRGVNGSFRAYQGKGHSLDREQLIEVYDFIKYLLPPLK
ncbi:lysophospholipase-like protein 1 [Rhodnius prolixus]|uniref:lysophospholipase-like protein 1 n=1 Tax=Rhodnius prolixus TaxID=13249 RepID=UPI003D187EC9